MAINSAILTEFRLVTNGQTDRQTDTGLQRIRRQQSIARETAELSSVSRKLEMSCV